MHQQVARRNPTAILYLVHIANELTDIKTLQNRPLDDVSDSFYCEYEKSIIDVQDKIDRTKSCLSSRITRFVHVLSTLIFLKP